jgi:multidrug efflux system membrane fusion protein
MKVRINRSYVVASAIALVAAAWILSGQFRSRVGARAPSEEARAAAEPAGAPPAASLPQVQAPSTGGEAQSPPAGLPVVRVRVIEAESRAADLVLRGRTEAERKVEVKAETSGVVAAVPAEEGAQVKAGDVLCELNVDSRQAMLDRARAQMQVAWLTYDGSRQLGEKGYRPETVVATDLATYQAAKAEVERMEKELANTRLRAPFDGVVDHRMVEVGDFMGTGSPCALVIDEDPFLVIAQVSERDVNSLSVGDRGEAKLITGETVQGEIRFVAKRADPSTRTFRVELQVPNPDRRLRDGVTAEIRVSVRRVQAHRLSPAILVLDDAGRMGVRIVDDGVVDFLPVEIVGDGREGVWVTGLPPTVTVITVGQEYVNPGQRVRTVEDGKS